MSIDSDTKPKTVADRIAYLRPCRAARKWARGYTSPAKAWRECEEGSWMLWLLIRTVDWTLWRDARNPFVNCCLDCAESTKHLWPESHLKKISVAITVLRRWMRGKATTEKAQVAQRELNDATYYATHYAIYYAIYYASDADRAKSLAKSADIVRNYFPKPPKVKQ